ncbi:cyclic diguanylate phosphodiesterase [Pseudomonas citronellolis]|uniref:EAL domain-containing protein n=1 Tax=Pseudomonas citronellolis TaxID=53408 RepID=UPI002110E7E8|nr:cyclic diguanylate phosphodiesterase [Pseudomonas citronellolis]UUC49159.1 cyclic diguanylate phosphodiesterase [Pseudomonas citronellolis]
MPGSSKVRRLLWRLCVSLLVALLPLLLGGGIIYWQTLVSLQREAGLASNEALHLIDVMLGNAAGSARATIAYAEGPCAAAELVLREQVATVPFVRTVNLVRDGRVFCSSLFGNVDEAVNTADFVDGRLNLLPGNAVTPDFALIVYRLAEGPAAVLAAVDGRYLSNVLQLVDQRSELLVQVGPRWMDEAGEVHEGAPDAFPLAETQQASTRFPYQVVGGFPAGAQWGVMRDDYWPLFAMLAVLGGLFGLGCYWMLGRAATPAREIERAMYAGEFVPFLQPLVDAASGRWIGAEVLMRWRHPRAGLVSPDIFIPLAEQSGLIVPMTRALLQQLAAQLPKHAHLLGDGFHLGVNVSAVNCRSSSLLTDCLDFLGAFPVGSVQLMLELTERELIDTPTDDLLGCLRDLGVTLAIDDFGTGHSSLAYLRRFRVDALKIDKSFVATVDDDSRSRHILDSILDLCDRLDLQVIAEGIETPAQRDYLAARGVPCLQGYLFGKPMPLAEFVAELERRVRTGV